VLVCGGGGDGGVGGGNIVSPLVLLVSGVHRR
jgi:hypothetical protein